MKEPSRSSTTLIFPQTVPTISFQRFGNKNIKKKKMIRLMHRYQEGIGHYLTILGVGALFLVGTYLFCIQLAEYGW